MTRRLGMPALRAIAAGLALVIPATFLGAILGYLSVDFMPKTTVTGTLYTFISGFTLGAIVWAAVLSWIKR